MIIQFREVINSGILRSAMAIEWFPSMPSRGLD